jgi:molybdopterin converting factor small subunit
MLEGDLVLFGCLSDFEVQLGGRWSSRVPETTIETLLAEFVARVPEMSDILASPYFKVAINNKVQPKTFTLQHGDTVALLPPVTGG